MNVVRRYATILGVFVQDSLAYKSQAVLWMLTDIAPAIIMPFVWMAGLNGRDKIGGYDSGQIVMYYLTMTFLSNFVVAHLQWEIAFAAKDGQLSKFLLYPFSYMRYQYLGNIAWRMMRVFLFVPFALLWFGIFSEQIGAQTLAALNIGWEFWVALILGHLTAFFFAWALGMLAFYFIEVHAVYFTQYMLMAVFSGQLAPFDLLPPILKTMAAWTPFRYTLSFPLDILNGRLAGDAVFQGIGIQLIWMVVLYALGSIGWKYGSRLYTGTGM